MCWITLLLSLVLVSFFVFSSSGHYIVALLMERQWAKANPKSRRDFEQYLYCYNKIQIDPKQSLWGKHYTLLDGDVMIQYQICWDKDCPLDIVYDSNDQVRAVFTSYE